MALKGNEVLQVQGLDASGNLAATTQQTTTAAIAALGSAGGTSQQIFNTNITTVGAGTLTAAALVGGLITRTGPVAAYSDTTDTAAAIVAALPEFVSGATFYIRIKNATSFLQTILAGTNVTLPPTAVVGPWQQALYYGVIGGTAAAPTVTFNHVVTTAISEAQSVVSPAITTLATNGAGTLLAAAINGGFLNRTTVAAAFADTTDTAAAIIAANPGLVGKIGASFVFVYANNSTGVATIGGGMGVTVSGVTTVPPGVAAEYLITYTAAATLTMVGIGTTEISPNNLIIGGATSGQVTVTAPAVAGAAALTLPPTAAGTLASTSGANLNITDVYRCTAIQTANANIVPATVTGLVTNTLPVGTYKMRLVLYTTIASATAGIAITGLLAGGAVLGVGDFVSTAYLAATMSCAGATSVASPISFYTAATQPVQIIVEGTFTVTTPGALTIQMCQNTSNASNSSVNVGSYLETTRIA